LRESALNLVQVCQIIPQAVFQYLSKKFTASVSRSLDTEDRIFRKVKKTDDDKKAAHLKNFRPNLENPAIKLATQELNQREIERTDKFKEIVDET